MSVIYPEIEAYNKGTRDTILIHKVEIQQIQEHFHTIFVPELPLAIMVVRDIKQLDKYEKLRTIGNIDYVLGTLIGYPPKCVQWFSSKSDEERRRETTVGVHAGTYSFKCPVYLVDYAVQYMEETYNLESWLS